MNGRLKNGTAPAHQCAAEFSGFPGHLTERLCDLSSKTRILLTVESGTIMGQQL